MIAALAALPLSACAPTQRATRAPAHGTLSRLSTVESAKTARFCAHAVPERVCTRCHPELVSRFKQVGDWCGEHAVPESQCLICHPELSFEPPSAPPPGADVVALATHGEDVAALEPHVAPGKVTVFDFHADWCAPCRTVDEHLTRLLRARTDLATRKLNVVSWETALARHYLAEAPTLPFVVVFDRAGKRVGEVSGLDLDALDRLIQRAGEAR